MTGFELRCRQAREFRDVVRLLDASCGAPLHEVVSVVVAKAPHLPFEYFQIAFSDWTEFRLESQAEIDAALTIALQRRGVAA